MAHKPACPVSTALNRPSPSIYSEFCNLDNNYNHYKFTHNTSTTECFLISYILNTPFAGSTYH